MTRHIFSYGIRLRQDSRIELFPAAELMIQGRRTQGIRATFHIDSWATISVLPASDAKALGIPLRRGKKIVIGGITGEPLQGYQHTVTVALATGRFTIPVAFVEHNDVPRILGRDGVFTQFIIIFDEPRRRVAFLEPDAERTRIDSLFTPDP
jgi:hypothetical protein